MSNIEEGMCVNHVYSRSMDQEYPRKCTLCGEVEPETHSMPVTDTPEPEPEAEPQGHVVYLFTPEKDIQPYELAESIGYLFNCRDGMDPRALFNRMHPLAQRHFTLKPM